LGSDTEEEKEEFLLFEFASGPVLLLEVNVQFFLANFQNDLLYPSKKITIELSLNAQSIEYSREISVPSASALKDDQYFVRHHIEQLLICKFVKIRFTGKVQVQEVDNKYYVAVGRVTAQGLDLNQCLKHLNNPHREAFQEILTAQVQKGANAELAQLARLEALDKTELRTSHLTKVLDEHPHVQVCLQWLSKMAKNEALLRFYLQAVLLRRNYLNEFETISFYFSRDDLSEKKKLLYECNNYFNDFNEHFIRQNLVLIENLSKLRISLHSDTGAVQFLMLGQAFVEFICSGFFNCQHQKQLLPAAAKLWSTFDEFPFLLVSEGYLKEQSSVLVFQILIKIYQHSLLRSNKSMTIK